MNRLKKVFKTFFYFGLALLSSCYSPSKPNFKEAENAESVDNGFCVKMIDLGCNGDCTLITYKDTQILIDCGGNSSSWNTIRDELEKAFPNEKDTVLDYVIFSHGDSDHVISFASSQFDFSLSTINKNSNDCLITWLESKNYTIGTFIDFDPSQDDSLKDFANKSKLFQTGTSSEEDEEEDGTTDSKVYRRYSNGRNYLLKRKLITNYYTGSQCLMNVRDDFGSEEEKNKYISDSGKTFTSSFQFSSSPKGVIHILDNYFSYHSFSEGAPTSVDRNIISNCVLIEFDGYQYLFTGDLPEFDSANNYTRTASSRKLKYAVGISSAKSMEYELGAESLLLKRNYDLLKNGVLYFKAGHHGSMTSNSENLLNIIRPQYIGISCCAAGQYNFPKDSTLTQMCQYTDKIYLTSYKSNIDDTTASPYHGTTAFTYKSTNPLDELLTVTYTNMQRKKSLLLDDTIWNLCDDRKKEKDGKNFRRFPIRVIELSSELVGGNPCDCTYIKLGSLDILVNAGVNNGIQNGDTDICRKIEALCNDHVLDYLIVTTQVPAAYSTLITLFQRMNEEVSGSIRKVNHFIISPFIGMDLVDDKTINDTLVSVLPKDKDKKTIDNKKIKYLHGIKEDGSFPTLTNGTSDSKYLPFGKIDVSLYGISIGHISILKNEEYSERQQYTLINSLGVNIDLMNSTLNYLNLGHCYYSNLNLSVINQISTKLTTFTMPHYGYCPLATELQYINELKKKVNTNVYMTLLNSPLGVFSRGMNGTAHPVYPIAAWANTWVFKSTDDDNFVRTNRFVRKNTNILDTEKSYIDIEQVLNYPFSDRENAQYRKSYRNDGYFSFYNIEAKKYFDYTNYFTGTTKEDDYVSYLK